MQKFFGDVIVKQKKELEIIEKVQEKMQIKAKE